MKAPNLSGNLTCSFKYHMYYISVCVWVCLKSWAAEEVEGVAHSLS